MNRNTSIFCFLVITLAALGGCSSGPTAKESKKAANVPDKIQGKAQVMKDAGGASDAALNAGGPTMYIWEGLRRYRLFLKTPVELVHGEQYVVEGVYAQKTIDEIGDPDQGKNGYPLQSSCERVVRTAWSGMAFDATDGHVSALRAWVKRYPARAVFLVTKIQPVTAKEGDKESAKAKKDAAEKDVKEVSVAADKQRALLIEGPTVHAAPLWSPTESTVRCKVLIGPEGKIEDLETGAQLCEAVPWSKFSYKPTVQGGSPVKVRTEVEVKFEPRK